MGTCAGGLAVGIRKNRRFGIVLGVISAFTACAPRPPVAPASRDAQALLKDSPSLTSVALVHMISRDTLYRFTPGQVDSLKEAFKKSFVSESLLLTPSPWPVALVLKTGSGTASDNTRGGAGDNGKQVDYVALHYGDVLRVNTRNPWSSNLADSTGAVFANGVADIVLDSDDVLWIYDLVQAATGTPPSKSHRTHDIPLKPFY